MGATKNSLENIEWDLHEQPQEEPKDFTEENNVELFGIEPVKAKEMVAGLSTTLSERQVLKDAYVDVIELNITTENLPTFKELRLKIMKNRTQGLTKWKDKEKAFYLAGGNFIQAIYNKEVAVNEEMESKLLEAEKFFENQEKEKARLLNLERIEKVRPYVEDVTGLDFSEFDDKNFDDYVLGKKTRFENESKAKKEAEELAEKERLAEIERQRLIEVENAKLKALALEKEKIISKRNELLRPYIRYIRDYDKVLNMVDVDFEKELSNLNSEAIETMKFEAEEERKRQQSIIDAQNEKDARLRAEKELQAKKDAEIKAEKEHLQELDKAKLEAEKLARAPIKKQLYNWVESFDLPPFATENKTAEDIFEKFESFKKWSLSQVN